VKIALCAGEPSGDLLGADLIQSLKKRFPDATFTGIAGPHMQAAGCESLFPMEALSVMGVAEVIPKLIPILKIRKKLIQYLLQNPPDVFIGIDSPDFTLGVEKALKKHGIKTVHYVSPTVWAWREKRVLSIKKSTDLMLCVFPFEPAVYAKYGMDAVFIGHPAAERFHSVIASAQREAIQQTNKVITLMPGSRSMELKHLVPVFFAAAQQLYNNNPKLTFLLPVVKPAFKPQLETLYQELNLSFPLSISIGNSRECMERADVILCASGTTTLEAMFLKKPMVVAYKMTAFNWWLAQRLVKVKYIAIPNLLADKKIVPEFVQDDATVHNLAEAVELWLNRADRADYCDKLYGPYCEQLSQNASEKAADAITELLASE
jgi:lipid-A-disaccharide synthase